MMSLHLLKSCARSGLLSRRSNYLLQLSSSSSGGDFTDDPKESWKWRSNFYKNYFNKLNYGQPKHDVVIKEPKPKPKDRTSLPTPFPRDPDAGLQTVDDSTAYWFGQASAQERQLKKLNAQRDYALDTEASITERGGEERAGKRGRSSRDRPDHEDFVKAATSASLDLPRPEVNDTSGEEEKQAEEAPKVVDDTVSVLEKVRSAKKKAPAAPWKKVAKRDPSEASILEKMEEDFPLKNNAKPIFVKNEIRNEVIYDSPLRHEPSAASSDWPSVDNILLETVPDQNPYLTRGAALEKPDPVATARDNWLRSALVSHFMQDSSPDVVARDVAPLQEENGDEVSRGLWQSLEPVLEHFSCPYALGSHVEHEGLKYQDRADCVAVYKGAHFVLIHCKATPGAATILAASTSRRTMQAADDLSLVRTAARLGALNHDPRYDAQLVRGCVLVAHADGRPAQLAHLTSANGLVMFWRRWLERLATYRRAKGEEML